MEDMLFAAVEGLCREQGDMAEITAGYLEGFYKREMKAREPSPYDCISEKRGHKHMGKTLQAEAAERVKIRAQKSKIKQRRKRQI